MRKNTPAANIALFIFFSISCVAELADYVNDPARALNNYNTELRVLAMQQDQIVKSYDDSGEFEAAESAERWSVELRELQRRLGSIELGHEDLAPLNAAMAHGNRALIAVMESASEQDWEGANEAMNEANAAFTSFVKERDTYVKRHELALDSAS